MIFKILLPRSVQTPNSDKKWQTSCPLQTFVCNISRHLVFIIEQGLRVNWVSGSLDSRVTGSLGHKMWPNFMSGHMLQYGRYPGGSRWTQRGADVPHWNRHRLPHGRLVTKKMTAVYTRRRLEGFRLKPRVAQRRHRDVTLAKRMYRRTILPPPRTFAVPGH